MIKNMTFATALVIASTSFALAKDTLYIINSGSTGGSYNAQLTAWMTDLNKYYDTKYVQAKGCSKAAAVIRKITSDENTQILSLYSSTWKHSNKDCQVLYPSDNKYLFSNQKSGVVFSKKDTKIDFLTDGAVIGINGTNDVYINKIASINNINLKTIRYENSKGVTLGVLNGEVDFGITNSSSRFWKAIDGLKGHYVLSAESAEGIPSITTIGGDPKALYDNYIYFGNNSDELLSNMRKVFANDTSAIRKWQDNIRAYITNLNQDDRSAYIQDFMKSFPTK